MFNQYQWSLYLKSGGQDVVDFFRINLEKTCTDNYVYGIADLHDYYCPVMTITKDLCEEILGLNVYQDDDSEEYLHLLEETKNSNEPLENILFKFDHLDDNISGTYASEQETMNSFLSYMASFTTFLAQVNPEKYIPYYFQRNFNVLSKIAETFNIELPSVPLKKESLKRVLYYSQLCETFHQFRKENNLTPYELYAFLYDYAVKVIGGKDSYIMQDIPAPQNAFFIGSSKKDLFYSEDPGTVTAWQCSPYTQPGDYAVMYLKTPDSAVGSVWRCVSEGFIDPFFYYYRCAYIANPIQVHHVTLKQLRADKIFKGLTLVRKNMEGVNGTHLLPSQFNHLMDMANSDLPRLTYTESISGTELTIEKNVEEELIKPLLKRLGYEGDYEQQVRIKAGNQEESKEWIIPDFLIHINRDLSNLRAFAVVEAKFAITQDADLEKACIQVRSYARQVLARFAMIASKDFLWLYSAEDDFTEPISKLSWADTVDDDTFNALNQQIGKKGRIAKEYFKVEKTWK
ncbi:MAG: hypothetical protein LKE33_12845 [Acidaminococcus sp.]|jgi:hypothetical protein|nr:hypothetical protein [Acidaminococcus sp.]MCI2100212.1 hypothetical protein [Acidaminococcus sp.]MCI2114531.1 hypothetical protein [Acidaminococcus sp.]MCI2116510.1 hypothetical protein [Acidaminococcus sp.]